MVSQHTLALLNTDNTSSYKFYLSPSANDLISTGHFGHVAVKTGCVAAAQNTTLTSSKVASVPIAKSPYTVSYTLLGGDRS